MRRLSVILFLVLAFACDKDDDPEKFTSINGYWVVRTPDDATTVTFRIVQDSDSEYAVDAVLVSHNGTNYDSKPVEARIAVTSPTEIESITLINTDATIPFFVIRFQQITVNSDFTEMDIGISSFTIDGVINGFPMIKATRN